MADYTWILRIGKYQRDKTGRGWRSNSALNLILAFGEWL